MVQLQQCEDLPPAKGRNRAISKQLSRFSIKLDSSRLTPCAESVCSRHLVLASEVSGAQQGISRCGISARPIPEV